MRDHDTPRLGDRLISDFTTSDLRGVSTPIRNDGAETARRFMQRIGAVARWVEAKGSKYHNSAGDALNTMSPRNSDPQRQQKALHHW